MCSWQVILLIANAVLGIIILEWAWQRNTRFRQPIEELDNLMPAFRRNDAKKWARWKFYPGAMTLMIPRFIGGVTLGIILCMIIQVLMVGQPIDEPISGYFKKTIIRIIFKFFTFWFQLFTDGAYTTWRFLTPEDVNYYEEWLGPKETQQQEQSQVDFVD